MSASEQPTKAAKNSTRMSGTDQLVWKMVDDQDSFCIWAIASLTDPLHDPLITKTLQYLIQTIPILNARPVTTWFAGKWQFLEKEDVQDLILHSQAATVAQTEEQLQQVFTTPINAKQNAMIRIHTIHGPKQYYLVIQVHHLVVDGEGLKRVCAQFAAIYRTIYQDSDWTPEKQRDPCRSLGQIICQVSLSRLFLALPAYFFQLLTKTLSALQRKWQSRTDDYRLINTAPAQPLSNTPYFASILFPKELMYQAKAFTRQRKTTIHALLMASFALATREWNQQRRDQRNFLRFFYTANLRRWWGEPQGTFGNFSVILSFEELFQNLQSPAQALKRIQAKLDLEKKTIGISSFLFIMLLPALPYILIRQIALYIKKRLLRFAHYNQAMTNIGIILEQTGDFGHAKATGYSLLAPTVADGCLLFTISSYQEKMTLHLGCSEDGLTKKNAQEFLALWKEKLLEVIENK